MSDLERAQEWLGCGTYHDDFTRHYCPPEQYPDGDCPEATRLAALLAETRADALTEVAESLRESALTVERTKGATQRTWFMREMVGVLTNRAREVRDE